jgi:hypothetical protein
MSRAIHLLLLYSLMVCTGAALPLPLVHVARCMEPMFVCVMKTGYRKSLYVDLLKAVFRAEFWYCTAAFWCGLLFSEFYFSPSRIAASHSMEDRFLIMKVCHTVKHITMQREDHFVLGAISQSQVCTCKFIEVLSQPAHGMATYRCDDTRGCMVQFWPPDYEHMCSKHVEAWNKLIIKFSASSWLILR